MFAAQDSFKGIDDQAFKANFQSMTNVHKVLDVESPIGLALSKQSESVDNDFVITKKMPK